jgi:hypothetical protein
MHATGDWAMNTQSEGWIFSNSIRSMQSQIMYWSDMESYFIFIGAGGVIACEIWLFPSIIDWSAHNQED